MWQDKKQKQKIGGTKAALEALHLNLFVSEVIITVQGYIIEQGKERERIEIDNVTRAALEQQRSLLKSQTMRSKVQGNDELKEPSQSGKSRSYYGQLANIIGIDSG